MPPAMALLASTRPYAAVPSPPAAPMKVAMLVAELESVPSGIVTSGLAVGLPESPPVPGYGRRAFVDPVGGDVIADVFRALEEIGLAVVPDDDAVYAGREVRRESVPVRTDGLRIPLVGSIRRKVVADVLIALEEVGLAIGPDDARVDSVRPQPGP